jgi:hypothetical protein
MAKAKRGKGKRAKGTVSDRDIKVELTPVVEMLHEHITEALCQEVFRDLRFRERERKWTLYALARFWLDVIIEAPPSLSQLLELMRNREREGFLPEVAASAESFFEKCQDFSPVFFSEIHRRFIEMVLPKAAKCYGAEAAHLGDRFTDVLAMDGSRLNRIAKRLKILRKEKAVILPGSILAVYDLLRGITRDLWFDSDAAASGYQRAELAMECLAEGSLVLGDRLYSAGVGLLQILDRNKSFGVFRKSKNVRVRVVETLSTECLDNGKVEDILVEAGSLSDPIKLRLIRFRKGKKTYEVLTNVLDPRRLSAEDIVELYPLRWEIERLFYDLKIVLNLQRFYAANPNAVAMQVYAATIVHAAFRLAQAEIAKQVDLPPEELSPQKLFPLLAYVSIRLIESEYLFDKTCEANRKAKLGKPSFRGLPGTVVSLKYIRRQRRSGPRKKRPYDPERGKWKSITKVKGAAKLT